MLKFYKSNFKSLFVQVSFPSSYKNLKNYKKLLINFNIKKKNIAAK